MNPNERHSMTTATAERMVTLVAQTIGHVLRDEMTTEEMLRAAMKEARDHWIVTDENQRLMGAIVCVSLRLMKMPERAEDMENLRREVKTLQALSGIMSGLPIDLAQIEAPEKAFGLGKMWNEIKGVTP